MESRK